MNLDELKICLQYRNSISALEESMERLRSEMERTTQVLSQAPAHTSNRDKLLEQVRRMQELEAERALEVVNMEEHIDRCRAWLSTIPEQQALILELRYMKGMSWKMVAKHSNYSMGHCTKIHAKALEKMRNNA